MSGEATDAQLLAATARGDDGAFGVLVRRYIRPATLLAAQLVGDADDADDIVQEAFTVVHRQAPAFDPERPYAPWFYAIVRRLAANRLQREWRRSRLLRLWSSGSARTALPPDRGVFAKLEAEAAGRAWRELPAMQRACFELVVLRGLSYEEAAVMHDISESTARQHVFRARAALRTVLGDDDA